PASHGESPFMIEQFLPIPRWRCPRLTTVVLRLGFLVILAPTGLASDPPERLTAEQRNELERQARELHNAGFPLYQRGQFGPALEKAGQALRIRERLYPKPEFPQGHSELAESLNAMGLLLQAQGLYGEARVHFQRALAMRQALYPQHE